MPQPQLLVIGGGLGGIAAALRSRALGYQVTLLERNPTLGGRGSGLYHNGWRYDSGPTVITAPHLLEELFTLFGQQLQQQLTLQPLQEYYRFHFPDGSHFAYGGQAEQIEAAVRAFAPADGDGYRALLEQARQLFTIGFEQLAERPFHHPATLLRHTPELLRLGAWRSVHRSVARHLRDPRLRQVFSTPPLLVGGNPFDTTAIYLLIHYLEQRWGVHYPLGGVAALMTALHRLLRDAGVVVETNCEVIEIQSDHRRRVTGVRLATGEELPANQIIADLDPLHLYQKLIGVQRISPLARLRHRYLHHSMGLFLLHFATRQRYPAVGHHSILFGQQFRQPLEEIFYRGTIPQEFAIYLHHPSATDPSAAPPDRDTFYALVPVPNLAAPIDWEQAAPQLRQRLLDRLAATLLPGVEQQLLDEVMITPHHFAKQLRSHLGCGFSIAPRFQQSAWFRFHNRSPHLDGLYLVGAGTHPGAGVPGVLSSAKVVERLLQESQRSRK